MKAVRKSIASAALALAVPAAQLDAQPSGVTGYEVITIGVLPGEEASSVHELDDLARIVGSSGRVFSTDVVWIDGVLYVVPTPPGYERPHASGIGNGGVIAGAAYPEGSLFAEPFAWVIGHGIEPLGLPPGTSSGFAFSCDASEWPDTFMGGVVGRLARFATTWRGAVPTLLRSDASELGDVNNLGEAVGAAYNHLGVQRPVLWLADGRMIDIGGEPQNTYGTARGVNDFTEVVGSLTGVGSFHWASGVRTLLPGLGACSATPWAINNSGLITGDSNPDPRCLPEFRRAVLWERANANFAIFDLNEFTPRHSDCTLMRGHDINNAGQIAAFGEYDDGRERGFLVTPYLFEMSDPVPGIAGEANTITVTGLQPNQRVLLAYGTREGAQKIRAGCPGGTLLIRDPQASPVVRADANGVATITVNVPSAARGRTIRMQAIAPFECDISHTVTWTFE